LFLQQLSLRTSIIRDMTPCSPSKVRQRFDGKCRLRLRSRNTCFMLAPCSAHSSIVQMEATWSSKTSHDFQGTARLYIPEDGILLLCLQKPEGIQKSNCLLITCYIRCGTFLCESRGSSVGISGYGLGD
jgi:hypothetical protein